MNAGVTQARIEGLFVSSNRMLTQFLRRLTRNRAVAEDLAQQAWTKMLEVAARGGSLPTDDAEFRAVLYTTARNLFIDIYRRGHFETRTVRVASAELDRLGERTPVQAEFEQAVDQAHVARIVRQALETLPERQREAVALWQQGECIASMAQRANVPRDTVLSRKKYAFAKLRAQLRGFALGAHFA